MNPLPSVINGNDESLYNIGVVSRMCGISMATLRAWERRYNFPEASRTSGGHRLYSEKDVLQLRWVKARIDEGMQTAQAINALRHQEKKNNLTLVKQFPAAIENQTDVSSSHMDVVKARMLTALLNNDMAGADSVLSEALTVSTPEDLILEVIGPAFASIGEAWEKGQISVAAEHLSTGYLRQRLLLWKESGPPAKLTSSVVLACAPDEWHEGGLLILGALLRRRRWPIIYLGQAVPLEGLDSLLHELRPAMIIFSATTEQTASSLMEWPRLLPDTARHGRPMVGFGGEIFVKQPDLIKRIPGNYLGDNYQEAIESIEKLLV